MDEIHFPLDLMQEIAQQITSESQSVLDEVSTRLNTVQRDAALLPGLLQSPLDAQLASFHQQLTNLLNIRLQLGKQIAAAAAQAQTLDVTIAQGF